MLSLPSDIVNAITNEIAVTTILLELQLYDSSNNPMFQYYTNFDENIFYNGNKFQPIPFEIDEFATSITTEVDNLTVTIDNVSLIPVSLFLNNDQRNRTAILYFAVLDNEGRLIGAFEVFRGFIKSIEFREEEDTSICKITISHELSEWKKETLRLQTYRCPWRFKDSNCLYSGSATWCDKSYNRCSQLGNTANFGGFWNLQDIVNREIIWGRKS